MSCFPFTLVSEWKRVASRCRIRSSRVADEMRISSPAALDAILAATFTVFPKTSWSSMIDLPLWMPIRILICLSGLPAFWLNSSSFLCIAIAAATASSAASNFAIIASPTVFTTVPLFCSTSGINSLLWSMIFSCPATSPYLSK